MSVRHVHARKGEYIAVHRDSGSSSDNSDGWLVAIEVIFTIIGAAIVIWIIGCIIKPLLPLLALGLLRLSIIIQRDL